MFLYFSTCLKHAHIQEKPHLCLGVHIKRRIFLYIVLHLYINDTKIYLKKIYFPETIMRHICVRANVYNILQFNVKNIWPQYLVVATRIFSYLYLFFILTFIYIHSFFFKYKFGARVTNINQFNGSRAIYLIQNILCAYVAKYFVYMFYYKCSHFFQVFCRGTCRKTMSTWRRSWIR